MAKRVRKSRIMTTSDYIQQLTQLFDDKFRRPTSFYNNGCCVGDDEARLLIETPRSRLTEEELSSPIDHYGSCFGTFEQISYFVPRLMELLNESEKGFEYGMLNFSFFRLLVRHEQEYRKLGLWDSIEDTMNSIFVDHTSTITVRHYDKAACQNKGWALSHFDYILNEQFIDDMLCGFFLPVLSVRQSTIFPGQTKWDEFILRWVDDLDAYRVFHVLDMIKRYGDGFQPEYELPEVFLSSLRDCEYTASLLKRAEPALASISSDTWLDDMRECLEEFSKRD